MSAIMKLIALVHRDRDVEGDALLGVLDRVLVRGLGDADGAGGSAGAREVERLHRDLEAVALLAEAVRSRNDDVGERERRGVGRALAHLVEVLLHLDARCVHRDDERGHPLVALGRIRLREDDRPRGVAGVRDERLRPVQDVLVAAALGGRLQVGDVGAGLGLREAEGAENRLLEERRQPLRLLLLAAGDDHRAGAEAVRPDRRADAGAAPVELLADEDPVEGREPEPTERLGHVQVHQAELVRLGDHVGRVSLMLVVFGRLGPDLLLGELASKLAKTLLLLAQSERDPRADAGTTPCSIVAMRDPPQID